MMKISRVLFAILMSILLTFASVGEGAFGVQSIQVDTLEQSEIPTKYNADYTSLNYVTSVKDQGDYGICWAFSAIACCESDAIKNHHASTSLDLSERHLAYFTYAGQRTGRLAGDRISLEYGLDYLDDVGGHDVYAQMILSSHIGLRLENEAPYSVIENNRYATLSSDIMMGGSYYLDNTYNYEYEDREGIKSAIMQYGAVSIGYHVSTRDTYLNTSTYAYHCPDELTPNHAVTVVGWDDEYSRTNFKFGYRPSGDGAWLVKNSYGASWGKMGGYFWLSYEDKSVDSVTAYDIVEASEYDNIYQYDGTISMTYLSSTGGEEAHYANVFTADGYEKLEAVGVTLFGDTLGKSYTIKVYKNPTSQNPTKGTLLTTTTGTFANVGYTNIPISGDIVLSQGDKFSIVLTTSASVGVDSTYSVDGIYSTSRVNSGESFTSSNGVTWRDASLGDDPYNIRLKALTSTLITATAKVNSLPTVTVYYGQNLKDAIITGGEVVDEETSMVLSGKWKILADRVVSEDGTCQIVYDIDAQNYQDVTAVINYVVEKATPTISIGFDKRRYGAGDKITPLISILNPYQSDATADVRYIVHYQIGDGEQILCSNGTIRIPEDTANGTTITIKVTTAEGDNYVSTTRTETLVVGELVTKIDNSIFILGGVFLLILVAIIYSTFKKF